MIARCIEEKMNLPGLPKPKFEPIDCGSCHKCCTGQIVLLFPESGDDLSRNDWKLHGEAHILNTKKNGDCIYLTPEGCSIYSQRPIMCKAFNCEKAAQSQLVRMFSGDGHGVIQEGRRRLAARRAS